MMGLEKTITEQDMDAASRRLVNNFRNSDAEPDLDVDGLSGSILSWLIGLFRPRKR